jgi:hypothetical protein
MEWALNKVVMALWNISLNVVKYMTLVFSLSNILDGARPDFTPFGLGVSRSRTHSPKTRVEMYSLRQ